MAGETLKVVAGNASGSTIELQQELVIGRATPGAGGLGGDSEISRVHARVYHDAAGQLMIEDLGSTNGTYVNGGRISSPTALRAGDQVRLGQTTLTVDGGAADAAATAVGALVPPAGVAPPPVPVTPPTQPLPAQQPPPPPPGAQYGAPPPEPGGRQGLGSKAPWIALAAVVVIALIVAGLAIGGVFSSGDKKSTAIAPVHIPATTTPPPTSAMPVPTTPSTPSGNGYPPGIINKATQRCAANGHFTAGQCRCVYTTLQKKLTFPQFVSALVRTKSGHPPQVVIGALHSCGLA